MLYYRKMPIRICFFTKILEQISGCYCPIFVFSVDRFVISVDVNPFYDVSQSQAVACANLYVLEEFDTKAEIPRNVVRVVLEKFVDIFKGGNLPENIEYNNG